MQLANRPVNQETQFSSVANRPTRGSNPRRHENALRMMRHPRTLPSTWVFPGINSFGRCKRPGPDHNPALILIQHLAVCVPTEKDGQETPSCVRHESSAVFSSFRSQCLHRFNGCRAPRRDDPGNTCRRGQRHNCYQHHIGICVGDFVELRLHKPHREQRTGPQWPAPARFGSLLHASPSRSRFLAPPPVPCGCRFPEYAARQHTR